MIWLASYPRSGNTYTRNILKEVYSMDSSYDDEPGWEGFDIVKTHFLPENVKGLKDDDKVVYLVRDGRDCICSLAHHMKDIAKSGNHLIQNMSESTIAAEGSYFGGWSSHVFHWIRRADWVIRYEDLITDPIGEMEKLREFIELPDAKPENLPSFEKLKNSANPYGIVKTEWEEDKNIAQKFYRKGKSGSWKEEMPEDIRHLFWSIHGDIMERLGYHEDGHIESQENFRANLSQFKKLGTPPNIKVLLEAQKLMDIHHDGVFRYVHSLVKYMQWMKKNRNSSQDIKVDLLINGQIRPLYSDVEEFQVVDRPLIKTFKEKMWKLYASFPPFIQRLSVSSVNAYYALKSSFYLWKNRSLFESYDLLHFTLPQNYYVFRFVKDSLMACTMHDMTHRLFPEYHLKKNVKNAERGIQFIEKNAVKLIAVSNATKEDTLSLSNIKESDISRIYESADREKFFKIYEEEKLLKALKKFDLQPGQYIFSLATLEPRKNLKRTLEAFVLFKDRHPESEIKFALGGKRGWKEKLGYQDREDIIHLGYIAEGDLPILYNGALFFLYCSLYEGFGLPLLESMRCGTPVVYGNNSSMREIVGQNGMPVDAENAADISKAIEQLILDRQLLEEMEQRSFKASLQFSWINAVNETFDFYRKTIKNQKINGF